jgi:hypothetical protein
MTATITSGRFPKTAGAVGEFITEDSVHALNRSLAEHGIEASQIITIFKLPGAPIANGAPARFRVLYRRG